MLCDHNAHIVSLQAEKAFLGRLQESGIEVGTSLLERSAGTNAIDLSITLRSDSQSVGAQHTCTQLDDFWLQATPLIFQKEELRGVFALIGTGARVPDHAEAISATAAKLLTMHMMNIDLSDRLTQLLAEQKAIIDNISNGLLVVDKNRTVRHINAHAARILNLDPQTSVGRKFSELIDFDPVIYPIFDSGAGYKDEELVIKTSSRNLHLSDTAVPVKDHIGNVVSIVNTFREFGDVRKVAQKLGGSQAVYSFDDIIGESPKIKSAIRVARKAAESESNILLVGESGAGKKLFAQAIHRASKRANGPFVTINCAALSRDLIEDELFGHVGGIVDGVYKAGRPGKLELATEGTVFLDEISSMPLDVQVKFLEVLQEKYSLRIGGVQSFPVDFRLIVASNTSLASLVETGEFRRDLLFRLGIIDIFLPPLRDRHGDIETLARHYFRKYKRGNDDGSPTLAPDILATLKRYSWPGNVRELQNAIERIATGTDDLPTTKGNDAEIAFPHTPPFNFSSAKFIPRPLSEYEKDAIVATLADTGYNITKTAQILNVSKPTLYNKIREYDIEVKRKLSR